MRLSAFILCCASVVATSAAPAADTPPDATAMRLQLLQLVNEARSEPRRCGDEFFAAAMPVRLSATLNRAAAEHAADMATLRYFEHRGSDGSTPDERVSRIGYDWQLLGENIASGYADAAAVMRGWLDSPHHCANIMDPRFVEMGIAWAIGSERGEPVYWSQTFATPMSVPMRRTASR